MQNLYEAPIVDIKKDMNELIHEKLVNELYNEQDLTNANTLLTDIEKEIIKELLNKDYESFEQYEKKIETNMPKTYETSEDKKTLEEYKLIKKNLEGSRIPENILKDFTSKYKKEYSVLRKKLQSEIKKQSVPVDVNKLFILPEEVEDKPKYKSEYNPIEDISTEPEYGTFAPYAKYYEDENYKNLKIHTSNLEDKVTTTYDYGDALPSLAGLDANTNFLLFLISSVLGIGILISMTAIGLIISTYLQSDEKDKNKIFEEYKSVLKKEGFTDKEIKKSFDNGIDQLKKYA